MFRSICLAIVGSIRKITMNLWDGFSIMCLKKIKKDLFISSNIQTLEPFNV